jgi:ferritin-like metal-binding protein YciE
LFAGAVHWNQNRRRRVVSAGTHDRAGHVPKRRLLPTSDFKQETAMTVTTLNDLFHETLKDIYYTEKKLVGALPNMANKASAPQLKDLILSHLAETEGHIERLEDVFAEIGQKPLTKKCEAIEGLLKEARALLDEIQDKRTLDAAIISSSQTVEHYEIARYGTLVAWAEELGLDKAAAMLQSTLDEELAADEALSVVADDYVNQKAAA